MAIAFGDVNGSAKKGGTYMKLEDGPNVFRMVGGILPRYLYWVENSEKKQLPFECLGFDREKEKFTNIEKDWVQATVKGKDGDQIKCSWAYAVQVINRKTGKLEILNLKKKMFESLISYCKEDQVDPTSYTDGFDIVVDRVKTGTFAYNVDYNINVVKMMKAGTSALTEEELELVKDLKSIDEVIPRPTSEEQKIALFKFLEGGNDDEEGSPAPSSAAAEAINELDDL